MQINVDRYFLHEHPAGAGSWQEEEVKELGRREGVKMFIGHTCRREMRDSGSGDLALKPASWMTNSEEADKEVAGRCKNLDAEWWREQHRHAVLLGEG